MQLMLALRTVGTESKHTEYALRNKQLIHNGLMPGQETIGGPNMSILTALPGFLAGIAQIFEAEPGLISVAKVICMIIIDW